MNAVEEIRCGVLEILATSIDVCSNHCRVREGITAIF